MSSTVQDLPLVGRQIVAEQKMFWRNPAAAGFTIVFPVLFLVIFSVLNGTGNIALPSGEVVRFSSYYLPGIIVFAIVSARRSRCGRSSRGWSAARSSSRS